MDNARRNFSDRRAFIRTTALAGIGWVPVLGAPKLFGDFMGGPLEPLPFPLLDSGGRARIGLIGYSAHRDIVLNAIPGIPGARLTAVALADGERSGGQGKCLPAGEVRESILESLRNHPAFRKQTRTYRTYQEMLEKEDLDIVASCLPNNLNAHASMAAARKGCHVISEKPLATDRLTLADLESVIRECRVQITAMLPMRFHPGIAAMRRAIADGLVGEPFAAFAQKSYKIADDDDGVHNQEDVSGAAFPWTGIDALDNLSYVTGMKIIQASAVQTGESRSTVRGGDNPVGILTRLSNGATGIVSLIGLPPETSATGTDRLRVAGTQGVIEMNGDYVEVTARNAPPRQLPAPSQGSILASFVAFLRGKGSHVLTSEEAFAVTRVGLAVRQAAEEGSMLQTC